MGTVVGVAGLRVLVNTAHPSGAQSGKEVGAAHLGLDAV